MASRCDGDATHTVSIRENNNPGPRRGYWCRVPPVRRPAPSNRPFAAGARAELLGTGCNGAGITRTGGVTKRRWVVTDDWGAAARGGWCACGAWGSSP